MVIQVDNSLWIELDHIESMFKHGDGYFIRMLSGKEILISDLYFDLMLKKWQGQDTYESEAIF